MKRFLVIALFVAVPLSAQQSLDQMIDAEMSSLLATYKHLHAAPELSTQEAKTSAYLAAQLRSLGYTVAEKVGKYEDPNATCGRDRACESSFSVGRVRSGVPFTITWSRPSSTTSPLIAPTGLRTG